MGTRKPPSRPGRAERRAADRAEEKQIDARMRLAAIEPGGAPSRPIEVGSASIVEPTALSLPCVRCDGPLGLDEHAAREIDGIRLRVVRARCRTCGQERTIYVRIVTTLPN